MDNYSKMVIFFYVVDSMGFSKAAERLGLSKAHVSKQITQLEKNMQTKLLERTTRTLRLTFAGEQLFKHCQTIVTEYHDAEKTILGLHEKPKGRLRITAPPAYSNYILSKIIPSFMQKYPDIQIEIISTGEIINLAEEKIDVAIRLTHTPPEGRIAKRIGYYQLQVCASTEYCKKNAIPKKPFDLSLHPCLIYSSGTSTAAWPFILDGKVTHIDVPNHLSCNTHTAIVEALLNHCGIARLPSYVLDSYVKAKKVKLLLSDYLTPEIPIYVVYAQSTFMPLAVRAFVDFLI